MFKNDNFGTEDFFDSHKVKTAERAASYPFVLAISDSTVLNYKGHSRNNGMGLFLGVLSNFLWFRDAGRKKKVDDRPTYLDGEDKESEKWNEGLEASLDALKSKTKVLSVCDREADSKTFIVNFVEMGAEFLVRHSSPRKINESTLLSTDYISSTEIKGSEKLIVTNKWTNNRGKSLRVNDEYGRYQRETTLNYQFARVTTDVKIESFQKTVALSIIRVFEEGNFNGRIDWVLITSLPIETIDDAKAMVLYYSLRWRIELFFKTLKSGCSVEKCRLAKFHRMEKFIHLAAIIAWRINWIKYLNEVVPESDASAVFSESEILILKKKANYEVGKPLSISQALLWIARLGGHLNRKNDGNPGLETIWKGMNRLHDLEEGFLLAL